MEMKIEMETEKGKLKCKSQMKPKQKMNGNEHENESAIGIKNVTINEPHFEGHFPSKPIMPGVLIIESMAQTAAILVSKTLKIVDHGFLVYFMSIENAKFRKLVQPGDVLHLEVLVSRNRRNTWKFSGNAFVEKKLVAEANFTAMMVDK